MSSKRILAGPSFIDLPQSLRYSRRTKNEMKANLVDLEALLRAQKLDGTLVSSRPLPAERVAVTGIGSLDERLGGGLVRGHLSEIVGPPSSGRTSVLCSMLASATQRGEVVALIDTFDVFDPVSGHAAGIDLSRLLWIRGHQRAPRSRSRRSVSDIERAIKASGLVALAGRFGLVAVDLADAPVVSIQQLLFTTWRRIARAIEGSETVSVVMGPIAMGRSALGRSIVLAGRDRGARWLGSSPRSRVLQGLDIGVRVESTRHPSQRCRLATDGFHDEIVQTGLSRCSPVSKRHLAP